MEFLVLIVVAIAGIVAGWNLRERYAMHVVGELLKEVQESEEKTDSEATRMHLERHGEVVYAFDEDDNFIAQGGTVFELDKAIQDRFPGKKFLIKEGNMKEVGFAHDSV